jgi:hypothetical protein
MTERPIPFMIDPRRTEDMERLRKKVIDGLGDEPWQVTDMKQDRDGFLLLKLSPKHEPDDVKGT